MHWNRVAAVTVVAGALLLTTACGNENAALPPAPQPVLHMSVVDTYDTMAELRADSSAVVLVTAGAARRADLHDVPMTVTDVHVDKVIAGSASATTLGITQFGADGVSSPDSSRLLVADHQYLLFVTPYILGPTPTGRFVIAGDQGAYELTDGEYTMIGAPGSKLPASLSTTAALALE